MFLRRRPPKLKKRGNGEQLEVPYEGHPENFVASCSDSGTKGWKSTVLFFLGASLALPLRCDYFHRYVLPFPFADGHRSCFMLEGLHVELAGRSFDHLGFRASGRCPHLLLPISNVRQRYPRKRAPHLICICRVSDTEKLSSISFLACSHERLLVFLLWDAR